MTSTTLSLSLAKNQDDNNPSDLNQASCICTRKNVTSTLSKEIGKVPLVEIQTNLEMFLAWMKFQEYRFVRHGKKRSDLWDEVLYRIRCFCETGDCWNQLSPPAQLPPEYYCDSDVCILFKKNHGHSTPVQKLLPMKPNAAKEWIRDWLSQGSQNYGWYSFFQFILHYRLLSTWKTYHEELVSAKTPLELLKADEQLMENWKSEPFQIIPCYLK